MARLGDLCRFINGDRGKNYPSQAEISSTGDVPFINAGHIVGGKLDFSDMNYISEEKYNQLNSGKIQENDVLYCLRGSLGKKAIIKGIPKGAIASSLVIIRPDSRLINSDYLFYALESPTVQEQMMQANNGSSQPNLSAKSVSDYAFNLPTINEQCEIVSKLAKVSEVIALRKEQLAKLDQLVKSRFIELFGDPVDNPKNYLVKSLQELIDMGYITYHLDGNHGGDYPRSEEFVDGGVPYIGANSIVNGEIDFAKAKYLTTERAGKLRKGIAQNEDVLFAHNATVGPVVVLRTVEPKVILSTSLTAYRCNKDKLLPNYLKAYMQSDGFVRQYADEMKQTTRNQVPITAQKKYLFLIPPIEEQDQFATFVEQTGKSKLEIQQSLDKLELLKKSLMQEYFG